MIKNLIKKSIPLLIILSFFVIAPVSTFAATPVKTKTSISAVKKSTGKSKVSRKKKKKVARREKLIVHPALFTLDTAPHTAAPYVSHRKVRRKTRKA